MDSITNSIMKKLSILEKMFYESKPFLYALIATYALAHHENRTLLVSGVVLAVCSVIVAGLRIQHRSAIPVRHE